MAKRTTTRRGTTDIQCSVHFPPDLWKRLDDYVTALQAWNGNDSLPLKQRHPNKNDVVLGMIREALDRASAPRGAAGA